MLQSMTGFGKSEANMEIAKISIQVKSLNSKQADINLKIPSLLKEREIQMRNLLSNKLERGKIEVYAAFENQSNEASTVLNADLFKKYHEQLKGISKELGENADSLIPVVAGFPDLFVSKIQAVTEEDWKIFFTALEDAANDLETYRKEEGGSLQTELQERIQIIGKLLKEVDTYEKERSETVKERIFKSLEELKSEMNMDRLEQEMIYYLEKYDITEEKVRLKMHLEYFQETMNENSSQGKKLGFISQEIGREINTLGAKANHAEIQKIVVQMKDELEKIKEQILNIL